MNKAIKYLEYLSKTGGKVGYDIVVDGEKISYSDVIAELKAKDERIAELEAMAQKMKCCENCKSHINVGSECLLDMEDRLTCKANNYSNWKLKDNK